MHKFYEKELLKELLVKKESYSIFLPPSKRVALALIKNVFTSLTESLLLPSGLTETVSTTDEGIQKRCFRSGMTNLILSNEELHDIMKMVKSYKHACLLIKVVSKTTDNDAKKQKAGFLAMLLGTLAVNVLGNILAGKEEIRASEGVIGAGQDF